MDWDKIEQLFNIGSAATEHGPKYASIAAAAQLELETHVAEAQKVIDAKVKADAEEAGRLRAEAANKAREEADKLKAEEEAQKQATEDRARAAVGVPTQGPELESTEPSTMRRI